MSTLVPAEFRALLKGPLRWYYLSTFLCCLGIGLSLVLYVLYLHDIRHLSVGFATTLLAANAVAALVVSPLSGTLTDRVGPFWVIVVLLMLHAATLVSWAFASTKPWIISTSLLMAVTDGAIFGPGTVLLTRLVAPEQRQRAYGVNFMMVNIGIGLGGLISASVVSLTDPLSFSRLYLGTAVLTVASALPLLRLHRFGGPVVAEKPRRHGDPGGWREVLADRQLARFVLTALVLLICGYGSLDAGASLFIVNQVHLAVGAVGVALFVNTVVIVCGQLFVLRFMEGRSRTRMMAVMALLWAVAWLLFGASPHVDRTVALVVLCLSMAIFGIGETIWSPVGPALVNDMAPEHLRGRYNATFGLLFGLSGSLAPLIAGAFFGAGAGGWWPFGIAVGCGIGLLGALNLGRHLTAAQDGRVSTMS